MTVEDNNFIIKNGLSVGTGKHQILDSSGRLTANYVTLNTGGRYLSAGVDLWDLFSNAGIPPLSTNRWSDTYEHVSDHGPIWDSVYSWVQSDSSTNSTNYNRNTFVNVSGDNIYGNVGIDGDVYLQKHLRVDGHTYLSGAQYIENDSHVMGDFKVDGNVELGIEGVNPKSIYLGATNDDRVVFRADIDSNIIPDDTITYDLGTSEQQWRELYVQDISASKDIWIDNDLMVSGTGTIGTDFRVSGHTTVGGDTVLSGTLDVDDATYVHDTLDVELDTRLHDDLLVTGNTTVSGNTVLSGTLDVQDFVTFYDDLSVRGDLYVDGNAYLSAGTDGNIYVGDTDGDNVVFRADINSNLIPEQHHIFDIGTDDKHWNTLFVNDISANGDVKINQTLFVDQIRPDLETRDTVDINAGTINFQSGDSITDGTGMAITSDRIRFNSDRFTFGDIRETADGWRPWVLDMNVDDQTAILSATLTGKLDATFEQNLTVLGDTTLGNSNTDNVVFVADVDTNIIPDDDVTYDLGTNTQQWRELFVHDISASNDIFVDNDLLVSANGTIGQDFRVSGHTTISGNTTLSGTLAVDDTTYIYDTLDVELKTTLHDDLLVSGDTHIVGDLRVDGNAYLSAGVNGIINVGDKNTDNVVFHADIDSGITPNLNITYDLGTNTQQWRELFVQDISASNDIFVDNDLLVSANGTIGQDFRVSGHTTVEGNTVLSGELDVEQDTTIHGHVSAVSGLSLIGDLTANDSVFIRGNIYVEGHSYFGFGLGTQSKLNLGDANVDEVVFQADVGSDIIPHPSRTYNLGASAKRWDTLYIGQIDAYGRIYTSDDFETKGNIIQTRDIGVNKTIESVEQIWRGENGSNTVANVETATFDSKYQSVKYNILVKTDTSVSTINADFVRNGTTVNGTTYGNVNLGTTEPLKSVDCGIVNSKFYLILNVERYAKVMITGKAMFLS